MRVAYCGICGSDFLMAGAGPDGKMSYDGLCSPPVTLGHEFSGWVEFSEGFPNGSAIVAEETIGCTRCEGCRTKGEQACEAPRKLGFTEDGAFAGSVVVPERRCWSVEEILRCRGADNGMRLAALVQPYSIAYGCFRSPGFRQLEAGDSVVVMGAGPIGLCAIDLARALGAGDIHVVEPWNDRRAIALKLGASATYSHEGDLPASLRARWLLDSSGAPSVPGIAERHIPGGALVLLNKAGPSAGLSMATSPGISVLVPDGHACPEAYPRIISLLASGALRGEPLVTEVVNLEGALYRLRGQLKSPGKILVRP